MTTPNTSAVAESIFDKNEGIPVKVSGTLTSAESFTKNGSVRVEVRLSPADVTGIDGKVTNRDRYTISYFISDKFDGWRPARVAMCVLGGVSNFLDLCGRNLTFDILSREADGKQFTDHKLASISAPVAVRTVTEAEALSMIHGKTPSEVLQLAGALGNHAKIFTVKPALLKAYPNRVTIDANGRYTVTS